LIDVAVAQILRRSRRTRVVELDPDSDIAPQKAAG